MSIPKNINLSPKEIEVLEEYVRKGGSLLIVGSRGGEHANRTNINELTKLFGFEFINDEINDSVNYVNLQKRPLISDIDRTPHYITENVHRIVLSSACSVGLISIPKEEKNIKVEVLIRGGLNCWRNRFNGKEWIEEDCPKVPLIVTSEYYNGQVVAFGTLSIFSSLGREYGFSAFNNDVMIANILRWLTLDTTYEGKVVTIDLQKNLFHWADLKIKQKRWGNISDIVNVSMKYFKDNYKTVMKEMETMRVEKYQRNPEKEAIIKEIEKKEVISLLPKRKMEDLDSIISAIETVSGEKYERTLTGDGEDQSEETELTSLVNQDLIGSLPEDLNRLTVKELKDYCKTNDINLPSKVRKKDIIRIIRYVLGED